MIFKNGLRKILIVSISYEEILITGGTGLLGTNLAVRLNRSFDTLILTIKKH